MLHHLGDGVHRLARTVSRCRIPLYVDRTCAVKAADLRRSCREFRLQEGIKRYHLPRRIADKDELRGLRLCTIRRRRLEHDLIGTAELIKVVDLVAAKVGLQCRKHVRKLHTEIFDLLAVNFVLITRRVDLERSTNALQLRTRPRLGEDSIHDVVQLGIRVTAHILQLERPAADVAKPRQSRRVDGDDGRLRCLHRPHAEHRSDCGGDGLSQTGTLRPILHTNKDNCAVGVCPAGENVKAVDRHDGILPLDLLLRRLLDLVHDLLCLIRGCPGRELNGDHQIALILIRDKRRREVAVDDSNQTADDEQEHDGNTRLADES